jgi:4-methylaminobutanoate oxidase (formaldehyde-forming)
MALRVTYVGELGWELHVPLPVTGAVFDALMAAGQPFDIRPVGYRALESLRLEKGYRAWSSDITPNDTPFEAGLGWAVKMRRNSDFLGRKALEARAGEPLRKRFAGFTLDDPDAVLVGRETILRDGEAVGYLTSGGYGYTVGRSIGYGYVRRDDGVTDDFLSGGSYELVVANEARPARIVLGSLYDPGNERVKS